MAVRSIVVGGHLIGLGAVAWLGGALMEDHGPHASVADWAWSGAAATAFACSLAPHVRSPGRCVLATVALAWWIPAVLPPSFLAVVPRALRHPLLGGLEVAAPRDPSAWLADAALVAGLLLLAWAPQRATPRGDEVRHPG